MDAVENWHEFNVALVGATAALAGLVIVAASVNITEIVKATSLTSRLAAGIGGLVLALTASAIGLIPDITPAAYGVAMVVVSAVCAVFPAQATRRIFENHAPENRGRTFKALVGFVAPLAYLIGSILLIAGSPTAGLAVFAAGSILAIMAALIISWVALVEVLR